MPNDFYGLPLHPLIVHATVVIIPLAVLTVILGAVWPRFRAWAGPLPVGLSLVGLVLVPLSTSTGETLEKHVERSALLEKHTQIAEGLLPWMIALFVLSAVGYALHWRSTRGHSVTRAVTVAVSVLAIVAAVGASVQVARIGHSGAKAAWDDTDMSSSARP
ncbi:MULTISPECIES: DUF2231 domain-containing protein [Aeromicrobium]|uniref:DUF2231 domain-containing protein n=1 Tax=Aeromicrobium TaxID=2040 RepID=UPI00070110FC|nr:MULTISPECIES: DUF2231 domain-containing protein [Aeromicrobium]KQX75851.1 hypothetical protein ASD10_12095 [Aeromicrobium sp. Root472D3]MBD8606401.1 hypothetical protein [Aeromicrobium sp. CFBP 8757]MCL8250480.1 hypothetical protein [Aeromicrobium fastidiosum]